MSYQTLFLQQSYRDCTKQYEEILHNPNLPWWDYVVLTASNEAQAQAYRAQISYRLKHQMLPEKTHYAVLPDPDGKRVGSGGATLNVLRYIREHAAGKQSPAAVPHGAVQGDGIEVSSRKGSENNDAFCIKDGQVSKKTNHAGGILGGISDGSPVLLRAHIKPTPSIFQPQQTIGRDHVERTLQIKGRHDPVIVPRAVVVVESMTALTILDLMLSNMGARMDHLEKIYTK